jgi:hypothetical protein
MRNARPRRRSGLRWTLAVGIVSSALLLPADARAALVQGRPVPSFQATDLRGRAHVSRELRGRPTLLVIMPNRDAAGESKQWVDAIGRRYGEHRVRTVGLIALDLPFFIPESLARSIARGKVPERFWNDTWLSARGTLADTLGVQGDDESWVVALDATGRVRAIARGAPTTVNQSIVFGALERR